MTQARDFHERAMALYDEAFFAKRNGDIASSERFSREALELEIQAAEVLKNNFDKEPSRSILYKSAAIIALDCKEYRQAEKLIASALTGNPPFEIAEELRNLLEQVHFERHLKLRKVSLSSSEIQLAMVGNEVSYGKVLMDAFVERVKDLERTIYRTAERLLNKDFRERGAAERTIQEGYSLYIAAPRAGSFAVTLQLGKQMQLPGLDLSAEVIDEVIECFDLVNSGKEDLLRERIPQEPYYLNFVNLAKRIAPDGEKVSMVGLTKVRGDKEIGLAITRKREEISVTPKLQEQKEEKRETKKVTGRLLFADATATTGKIRLIDDSGTSHSIIVPDGMMDDIVKPLWDEIVVVKGYQTKSKIQLTEIYKVED